MRGKSRKFKILALIYCFILMPLAAYLLFIIRGYREFILLGPDAELYLSVADNFLSTGHFIGNARPEMYVVPFGGPLILTLWRLLGLGNVGIVILQYFLFGLTCFLLFSAEVNLWGKGGIAPMAYALLCARIELHLGNVYLEHYFMLFECLLLWLLTRRDMKPTRRLVWMNVVSFAAFAVRTVLAVLWLPVLAYTVFTCLRDRFGAKEETKTGWKRPIAAALLFVLLPCAVMGVNACVNHRESGYWILTDNYSGGDLYIANNPNTKTGHYASGYLNEFVDERYFAIENDDTLDFTQKNAQHKIDAKAWITSHPGDFARNTFQKFRGLFFSYWRYLIVLAFLGGVGIAVQFGKKHPWLWAAGLVNLLLAAVTSMGAIMGRYAAPLLPLASLHLSGGFFCLVWCIKKLFSRKKTEKEPVTE